MASLIRPLLPLALSVLAACTTPSVVQLPTSSYPQIKPMLVQENTGSIFNPGTARLFFETQIAKRVGDSIVVSIEEDVSSSSSRDLSDKANGSTSITGPGALGTMPGLVKQVFGVDVDSSYKINDTGQSSVKNSNKVSGTIMVSVLDVMANGYLVVGGDKVALINGKQSVLRFSGVIDSSHIMPGNTISSKYVINARLDQLNQNMPLDAGILAWVQILFGAAVSLY